MRVGLCMIVRDEAPRLARCVAPLLPHLDAVAIANTGSTDGTGDVLRALGVPALSLAFNPKRGDRYDDARNAVAAHLDTPWVLHLDGDEVLAPDHLTRLLAARSPDVDGVFATWHNHDQAGDFTDHKCLLVRRSVPMTGRAHENTQTAIRRSGGTAIWARDVVLHHHPDLARRPARRETYVALLRRGLAEEPNNTRYAWFLGYTLLEQGHIDEGVVMLRTATSLPAGAFPVEHLNAHVVLAHRLSAAGRLEQARDVVHQGLGRHQDLAHDFEVRGDPRAHDWLHAASAALDAGQRPPTPHRFAC